MGNDETIVIAGAGLVTPVGLSLPETAASARARMARLGELEWLDGQLEPYIAGRVPDDGLPDLDAALAPLAQALPERETRMLRLAHAALGEAVAALPDAAIAARFPLLLALPEQHGETPLDASSFLVRLAQQARGLFDARRSVAAARGRAAGLMALREAATRLAQAGCDFVLVGGVDCFLDETLLHRLDTEGRIRTEATSDGFSPSEGAAFLLLAKAATARQQGLPALARLAGQALGQEPGHLYADAPYQGEGLAATLATLLAQAPLPAPIATVYSSFNGERYWAREFGVARLRSSSAFDPAHTMEHPAECYGEIGAACGPALAALAAHGLKHGYRAAPCLVYASSDRGERGVALLATA
ncbi:MAG: hypothetical protein KIT17_07315 [Rubrivivax sp.]|nr:hypothetical protein [Rubrivivax sp.]